jgi:hypothetical protein
MLHSYWFGSWKEPGLQRQCAAGKPTRRKRISTLQRAAPRADQAQSQVVRPNTLLIARTAMVLRRATAAKLDLLFRFCTESLKIKRIGHRGQETETGRDKETDGSRHTLRHPIGRGYTTRRITLELLLDKERLKIGRWWQATQSVGDRSLAIQNLGRVRPWRAETVKPPGGDSKKLV